MNLTYAETRLAKNGYFIECQDNKWRVNDILNRDYLHLCSDNKEELINKAFAELIVESE